MVLSIRYLLFMYDIIMFVNEYIKGWGLMIREDEVRKLVGEMCEFFF